MLRTILLAAVAATTVVGLASTTQEARAEVDYPYCAYAGGRNGYENCGYYTLGQCLEAVSGVGGHCRPNPYYFAHRRYSDRDDRPRR